MMWFRHRYRRNQRKRLKALAELRAREAVREAEAVVATAWADQLAAVVRVDQDQAVPLEFQQVSLARAARRRGRAAKRDRRRLAALGEVDAEMTETRPRVRHPRADGSAEPE